MHAALERLTLSLRFTVIPGDRGFESIPEMACRHSSDIVVGDVQTIRLRRTVTPALAKKSSEIPGRLGKSVALID